MNGKQARKMRQYVRKEYKRTMLGWLRLPFWTRLRVAWRIAFGPQYVR